MKIRSSLFHATNAFSTRRSLCSRIPLRRLSTSSNLIHELTSRPLNITYDYFSPTPSHLLNVSLCDFLPKSCHPKYFDASNSSLPLISSAISTPPSDHLLLHQGHHLVYFPPPITHHGLLPDGTDTLHSPAAPMPFTRRLWAGGSVAFNPSASSHLLLDGGRAVCIEGIRNVTIKGLEGDEKVFVHIERRIGYVNPILESRARHENESVAEDDVIRRIWERNEAAVVERRNLVFLRAREVIVLEEKTKERIVKAPHASDFSVTLTPPPSLLFRFSALTFNAHAIHLNPSYSRDVEGHRNLLVHGPLSLVLMLSVLRSQLEEGQMITSFAYRNLAPLYAEEEMRICLRRDGYAGGKYEVWIEGQAGGYAVKGSATVGAIERP